MAGVRTQPEHAQLRPAALLPLQQGGGQVVRAVVDGKDLVGAADPVEHGAQPLHEQRQRQLLVEHRHDHRELGTHDPYPRSVLPVERRVGTLLLRLAGAFLLTVAVVAVVAPRPPNITYARLPVLVCLVLGAVVVLLAGRLVRRVPDRRALDVVGVAVTLLGSAVSTVLAFALRYDFGWDARVVAGMAQRLASSGDLSAYQYGYLSRYPNNSCRCWSSTT